MEQLLTPSTSREPRVSERWHTVTLCRGGGTRWPGRAPWLPENICPPRGTLTSSLIKGPAASWSSWQLGSSSWGVLRAASPASSPASRPEARRAAANTSTCAVGRRTGCEWGRHVGLPLRGRYAQLCSTRHSVLGTLPSRSWKRPLLWSIISFPREEVEN